MFAGSNFLLVKSPVLANHVIFTDKNIVCTSKIGVESVKSDFECFCHLVTWDLLGKSPFLLHKSRSFPTFSGPRNSAFQVPSFQHSRALHLDRHHFASGSRPIFGSLSSSGWLVIFRQKTQLVGGVPTPLKNMSSSVGMIKIKFMFQTTKQ